ncbi:MAG TPA: HAMP domain-containing sensor histidine kinase [Candidatus Saccharimonadales bacterium]|nr:HAMP domain-containing sensor histidine kinase [Candidatus Saccharimonadales bacterium]
MGTKLTRGMFKSARLQLTFFYLLVLVGFSLIVTTSIRILAEREYLQSNMVQRGELHDFIVHWTDWATGRPDSSTFIDMQEAQAALVRQRLNQELFVINMVALVGGGMLSYWFAGRTLRPIEEAHETQARFAADASHELRTPLTNLRLENEVFLRQKHFTETDARELINSNLEEVQRLEGLSSNLLALTQYAQTPLDLKPASVKRIARDAMKSVQHLADTRGIVIATDITPRKIQCQSESMVQLLGILLDNAIKYGPEKGVITIGGRKQDRGSYALWVQDEGPGIAKADMPYIFDRLYRGDKARNTKAGGYGLGLSLARAIAKANDATLTVGNAKPHGARFTMIVPLAR